MCDDVSTVPILFIAPAAFLLYSQRTNISRMILDPGPGSMPDMQLPIANVKGVRAIDYDPVDNFVYWIDGRAKNIRRAPENSSNVRPYSSRSGLLVRF